MFQLADAAQSRRRGFVSSIIKASGKKGTNKRRGSAPKKKQTKKNTARGRKESKGDLVLDSSQN
ncbi:hypothetical protein TWF696_005977 [Orbilia brochopaga]|uniref:Uncharacterized protein n=1 Tax=Orbilia brochopaga TaxID=3140254 RepID=A0AAV9UX95_9PEZI